MNITRLNIINFKNIRQAELSFTKKLNCLIGNNGAGKTNVIDALYYLSMCKSAFGLTDGQSVNHEEDFFVLDGQYDAKGRIDNVLCSFKKGTGKVFKRNSKEYEKLSDHIGIIPVVLISPSDTSLINDSGEERRKFMNTLLSQYDRSYIETLIKYNHILGERNKLLKKTDTPNFHEILDILDLQLSTFGKFIHGKRVELIGRISPVIKKYYSVLSGEQEDVEIAYKSELNDRDLSELLSENRTKDIYVEHTSSGVHRDDIKFKISGYPIKKFGSQGQQKTFLIALKLSQFEIIAKKTGYLPILLLDDIFDKLDLERVERLIKMVLSDDFGQIFLTDSNKVRLENILNTLDDNYELYTVENGTIDADTA
ncbi:MAG: DNA replication and repair protein RecF [Rikenellaceae bacterium]|nr:DNA replication and repair protein RecF [Rikenellaceae bacterium]